MSGWIYIASNPSYAGQIKIGFTERHPENRMAELSKASGVPTPFRLEYAEHVTEPAEVELKLLQKLSYVRTTANREFFRLSVRRAIAHVAEICEPFRTDLGHSTAKHWTDRHGDPKALPEPVDLDDERPRTRIYQCPRCGTRWRIPRRMDSYWFECPKCAYRTRL